MTPLLQTYVKTLNIIIEAETICHIYYLYEGQITFKGFIVVQQIN